MRDAGLSFDIDSVAAHLEGYGIERPPDDGAAYRVAIPRILDLLERLRARATFFLVAGEARDHPGTVEDIVAEGHEVASHSMTHRLPFLSHGSDAVQVELYRSKAVLEALSGREVAGFRAPSWDRDTDLLDLIADAGYRYDASSFPSFLMAAMRWSVAWRSGTAGAPAARPLWSDGGGLGRPHVVRTPAGPIVEWPMCTTPVIRLPYYHTLRFMMPAWNFDLLRRLAHARRGPVWYQFHAVDFLGLEEDRLDPRIARHPGMRWPLPMKLAVAERAIQVLGRKRIVRPLGELVARRYATLQLKPAAPVSATAAHHG